MALVPNMGYSLGTKQYQSGSKSSHRWIQLYHLSSGHTSMRTSCHSFTLLWTPIRQWWPYLIFNINGNWKNTSRTNLKAKPAICLPSKALGCTPITHRLTSMLVLMHTEAPGKRANISQHHGNLVNQEQNPPIRFHRLESAQQARAGMATYNLPVSNSTVRKWEQLSRRSSWRRGAG